MSGDLSKEYFWNNNFYYEEDLLNKYNNFITYTIQTYVSLSGNKLYLDGLRNASFQPTALYFPFTFKHSISKKICKIKINKNYV